MNFLHTLKDSVYGPEFYASIPQRSLGQALKYFLALSFIIALLMAIPLVPAVFAVISPPSLEKIASIYPSDLVVKIINGHASTNQKEPYFVPNTFDKTPTAEEPKNLLVIDTKSAFSTELFDSYSTYALLLQDSLATRDKNGEIKLAPLKEIKDYTLDQGTVMKYKDMIVPYVTPAAVIACAIAIVGLFVFNVAMLIYFFFAALLVMLVSKLMKRPLNYGASYKTSIHASTLGILIWIVLYFLGFSMPPFSTTLLLLAVAFINISKSPQAASVSSV